MRTTEGRYTWPPPSANPSSMTRCSSSSAAALEGAHTRMRGLRASSASRRSNALAICAWISCGGRKQHNPLRQINRGDSIHRSWMAVLALALVRRAHEDVGCHLMGAAKGIADSRRRLRAGPELLQGGSPP